MYIQKCVHVLISKLIYWFIIVLHPAQYFLHIWRQRHYRWRTTMFRSMLRNQGLWAGRDFYGATPAVTRDLSFSIVIQRTVPFGLHLWHKRGCGESILIRILTGPNLYYLHYCDWWLYVIYPLSFTFACVLWFWICCWTWTSFQS
jgi:hypothetical protein